MQPKQFYYYLPKVVLVTVGMLAAVIGLTLGIFSSDNSLSLTAGICILAILLVITFFLVMDAIIPVIQHKPILIIDENGITDVISWGLIRWSNIQELNAEKVQSGGRSGYRFTEMQILLKDLTAYEAYRHSWWIRLKVWWIFKVYRGKCAHLIMDIDALKGDVNDVFNQINEMYLYYTSNNPTGNFQQR